MSAGYVIKEGFSGIKRARLASLTSMFSLFVAVSLLGILARISYNAYDIAKSLRNSVDVEVFLMDVNRSETNSIRNKLEDQSIVQKVNYISKDSAAAIFKRQFGADEGSSLTSLDFLPASFRLKLKDGVKIDQIKSMINEVKAYQGVEDVKFNQQLLEMLQDRFQSVVFIGAGVGILIMLAALILVFNTIRLTIYAKRNLIKAMKLVGATNGFIRRPFLIEGMIQGLVAGVCSVLLMYFLFQYILPKFVPHFGILEWPFGKWYYLSGVIILLAIIMGYLGSRWAARKFIKKTSIAG